MTAEDLRAQKALALLDAQEAREAKRKAESDYDAVVAAIGGAHNALSGFRFQAVTELRDKLKPFEAFVSVDLVVEALQRLLNAKAAQRDAEQKLRVFGVNLPPD